uniref:Uncharacterized protein n=1 Tax=Cucumis melo TaxID=3656 RepID=A0A9I9DR16_CUCME
MVNKPKGQSSKMINKLKVDRPKRSPNQKTDNIEEDQQAQSRSFKKVNKPKD